MTIFNSHHRGGHKYPTSVFSLWLYQKRGLAYSAKGQW